jgi:hypothetical protein
MKRMILLAFVLVFLSSCAAPWTEVGGGYSSPNNDFTVDLPKGWMKANSKDLLFITRDGILLQSIVIKRMAITEELQYSQKKFRLNMLPHEQAELIADDFASNPALMNFEILENSPITINGHKGFRLVFTYKNEDGLRVKSAFNGFLVQDWFYQIRYTAAARYYYDKDLATYEQVIKSFKIHAL